MDTQEPNPGDRFTTNHPGTKMDTSLEAILAAEDLLGLPEPEQRDRILARHAERPFGLLVAASLRRAGWLPENGGGARVVDDAS
jgi:hypothetical protein